jgi:hypothetical protein
MALGSGIRKNPIPDPGSRSQKGTGSRIRIRNTANHPLKITSIKIAYPGPLLDSLCGRATMSPIFYDGKSNRGSPGGAVNRLRCCYVSTVHAVYIASLSYTRKYDTNGTEHL